MPKKILVIGKNGQLGQSLKKISANYSKFSFDFVGRETLDLASCSSLEAYFEQLIQPYFAIINAAAYTQVDLAESEQELANKINHIAVKQLAAIAKKQNVFLVHVSTDYVFSGQGFCPYLETDEVEPVNNYGATKLLGEQAMQASGCAGVIVRTSWVYSEFGNNFLKTMLRLGKAKSELGVIFDQLGTPTFATDLAEVLIALVNKQAKQPTKQVDLYNFSNEGVASWYDFATAIMRLSNTACQVKPIETSSYPTPAKRPHFSLLNKGKIKAVLGMEIPHWQDSLVNCLNELFTG